VLTRSTGQAWLQFPQGMEITSLTAGRVRGTVYTRECNKCCPIEQASEYAQSNFQACVAWTHLVSAGPCARLLPRIPAKGANENTAAMARPSRARFCGGPSAKIATSIYETPARH